VKSALYDKRKDLNIVGFIGGLGGRDITIEGFRHMVDRALARVKTVEPGEEIEPEMIGVRE
jgi:pyruvate ferredoxin oxidoreductase alpha subunit